MGAFKELILVVLHYYEEQDLAPDEIAALLYMSEDTVRDVLKEYCHSYPGYIGGISE